VTEPYWCKKLYLGKLLFGLLPSLGKLKKAFVPFANIRLCQ
jgi:hypothetical protein